MLCPMGLRLVIHGGGKMGEALILGLVAASWAPVDELGVVEPVAGRRAELANRHPGLLVGAEQPAPAEGAVVAVKPGDVPDAARAAAAAGCRRLLSIAAGVATATLEAAAPGIPVVRAMPNTPALVGAGAAAIAAGSGAGPEDLDWAESILSAVGTVVRVPEALLDAVTGLSGSGPAYVFLVVEALIEGGVLAGLPRDTATALTV